MRILNVTAQKPHSTGSGVYLTSLVEAFAEAGCRQAVVAGVYADDTVCFPDGVDFYPVVFCTEQLPFNVCGMSDEMPYPSTRYRDMTPRMVTQFKDAFVKVVERAIDEFRPDVVFCHHLYLLAATLREVFPEQCIVGLSHGTCLRQLDTNALYRDEIVAGIGKLDHIFCLHEEQGRKIQELFGTQKDKVTVIGSGYNARVFTGIQTSPRSVKHIAYAGKIAEKKGVLSLLKALNLLSFEPDDLQITLAGGFNERDLPEARRLSEACRYAVDMPGLLSQNELALLLNNADVFVLPSFYEGLPLVLAEALACGCKVVCTDLPGVRPWMDFNVGAHGIRFVEPPAMLDADTPVSESLPAFEMRLASALADALSDDTAFAGDLSGLSWDGVAMKVLRVLG